MSYLTPAMKNILSNAGREASARERGDDFEYSENPPPQDDADTIENTLEDLRQLYRDFQDWKYLKDLEIEIPDFGKGNIRALKMISLVFGCIGRRLKDLAPKKEELEF